MLFFPELLLGPANYDNEQKHLSKGFFRAGVWLRRSESTAGVLMDRVLWTYVVSWEKRVTFTKSGADEYCRSA